MMRRTPRLVACAILFVAVLAHAGIAVAASSPGHILKYTTAGKLSATWGKSGTKSGQFDRNHHVALSKDGASLFIADKGNNRVQVLNSKGKYVRKWAVPFPEGIAVGKNSEVFVADSWNMKIMVYSAKGKFLRSWGSKGSANGQFGALTGLATDSSGFVYVADPGYARIQKFTRLGEFVASFGTAGSGNGQLSGPTALCITKDGSIYVAESGNSRVQKLDSTGAWLASYGEPGVGVGKFVGLYGVTVDGSGNVYATDWLHGVNKFSASGKALKRWPLPKGQHEVMGCFYSSAKKAVFVCSNP